MVRIANVQKIAFVIWIFYCFSCNNKEIQQKSDEVHYTIDTMPGLKLGDTLFLDFRFDMPQSMYIDVFSFVKMKSHLDSDNHFRFSFSNNEYLTAEIIPQFEYELLKSINLRILSSSFSFSKNSEQNTVPNPFNSNALVNFIANNDFQNLVLLYDEKYGKCIKRIKEKMVENPFSEIFKREDSDIQGLMKIKENLILYEYLWQSSNKLIKMEIAIRENTPKSIFGIFSENKVKRINILYTLKDYEEQKKVEKQKIKEEVRIEGNENKKKTINEI